MLKKAIKKILKRIKYYIKSFKSYIYRSNSFAFTNILTFNLGKIDSNFTNNGLKVWSFNKCIYFILHLSLFHIFAIFKKKYWNLKLNYLHLWTFLKLLKYLNPKKKNFKYRFSKMHDDLEKKLVKFSWIFFFGKIVLLFCEGTLNRKCRTFLTHTFSYAQCVYSKVKRWFHFSFCFFFLEEKYIGTTGKTISPF